MHEILFNLTNHFQYSTKKPGLTIGQGLPKYSDQQIIVDLDSAMNSWMDSVPDHRECDFLNIAPLFK